ncbi:MAG: Phosphate-starvation-inducible E [Methanomassiliicoccales archaeon PtaU1.Bin124]|nr:MAG: Phosphate-starvation-inducible E [Methanomassiliicoccales archaeon PtaU1.Bin124]
MVTFEGGVQYYKKFIIYILILALAVTIAALIISLIYMLAQFLTDPDYIIIDKEDILSLLGYFLLVVIAIELLDTLIVYTKKHVVKVEIVILVAITAVARELIVLDYTKSNDYILIGLAAIVVASALTYYLVRRARIETHKAGLDEEIS